MNIAIIGYGTQGKKRNEILKNKNLNIYIVDPYYELADAKSIKLLKKKIDYAFVCTPDHLKFNIIQYLIKQKINVLVEKPFFLKNNKEYLVIKNLLKKNKSILYVAYNHRFEPNLLKLKDLIKSKVVGNIYSVSLYYGNGTARLWRNKKWREKNKKGVVIDLAPHLLDIYNFLFNKMPKKHIYFLSSNFEIQNLDFAKFGFKDNKICVDFTTSLIDWKNKFEINVYGSKGSLHLKNLCKWDNSYLTFNKRILPSGKPIETIIKAKKGDPTWKLEHDYFLKKMKYINNNYNNDIMYKKIIYSLFK